MWLIADANLDTVWRWLQNRGAGAGLALVLTARGRLQLPVHVLPCCISFEVGSWGCRGSHLGLGLLVAQSSGGQLQMMLGSAGWHGVLLISPCPPPHARTLSSLPFTFSPQEQILFRLLISRLLQNNPSCLSLL